MSTASAPSISIVVPTYNSARFLPTALASVLAQTSRDYEVLVVDDGSTDDTRAVVEAIGGPVKYLHQANQGPAAARNTGIEAARGGLVCFLDADDSWKPEKLAVQVEFMSRHPSVGLVFADEEEFDERGVQCASLVSTSRFHAELAAAPVIDQAYRKLLEENFIPTSMVMVRRSCFQRTGLFDQQLRGPEDRDMWSRVAVHFPIAFVPAVLGRKRAVAASVSRDVETTLRSRIRLWTKARTLFPELTPATMVNALLAQTYVHLGFVLLHKGQPREARTFGFQGLALSRGPRAWMLAASLIACTLAGKGLTDFVLGTRRRLLGVRGGLAGGEA